MECSTPSCETGLPTFACVYKYYVDEKGCRRHRRYCHVCHLTRHKNGTCSDYDEWHCSECRRGYPMISFNLSVEGDFLCSTCTRNSDEIVYASEFLVCMGRSRCRSLIPSSHNVIHEVSVRSHRVLCAKCSVDTRYNTRCKNVCTDCVYALNPSQMLSFSAQSCACSQDDIDLSSLHL